MFGSKIFSIFEACFCNGYFICFLAPASPTNISFHDIQETSFTVSWTAGDNDTTGIEYIVQLSGEVNETNETQNSSCEFNHLISGTQYHLTVTAYYKDNIHGVLYSDSVAHWTYTSKIEITI